MNASPITLREVARVTGGRVVGDAEHAVRDIQPLADAGPDHLSPLTARGYLGAAEKSRAGALLVAEELADALEGDDRPRVVVADPSLALLKLLEHLHPEPEAPVGVHPTAVLGESVSLGARVHVAPYAVIGDRAVLADGVRVGAHAVVGEGCRVGEGSIIHAQAVLYARTVVGRRVIVHAGARLGVDGFGYARTAEGFRKIPQVGRAVIEDDVEIGANSCVDRGSIGDTVVGAGTKLDNLCHLAHNVRIGARCAFAAGFGVAGSTRIGDDVVAGGQAGVAGHLNLGDRVQIAAKTGVTHHADDGATLMGHPARDMQDFLKASALTYRLPQMRKQLRRIEEELAALRSEGEDPEDGG